jgi:hypothetical protein
MSYDAKTTQGGGDLPVPEQMKLFVEMSAILTGIDAKKLAPAIDPVNVKQEYFAIISRNAGADFQELLATYQEQRRPFVDGNNALLLDKKAELAKQVLSAEPALVALARNIMLLWYLGTWAPSSQDPGNRRVVSSKAYTQGWVWQVAQAHPMGFSKLVFGYWQTPPVALSSYIGGDES